MRAKVRQIKQANVARTTKKTLSLELQSRVKIILQKEMLKEKNVCVRACVCVCVLCEIDR